MRKTVLSAAIILLAALSAKAQFYTQGSDPSCIKWYSTETPFYKIIYPRGADSLAHTYGRLLEQFRMPVGHSLGITPGDNPGSKMPVVLHTHNMYANGSVAWAPRRMDLFTIPEPYGSDPTPWEIQLVSHEPRHQAQMQYAYEKGFKIGMWLFGEGFSPVLWALYLDGPLGEGDAVAGETGLAAGTRARTADFLNYYRVAYDQGDFRTWNRWRLGSFKHYAPDYYTIGYMTVAGERVFGDNPMAIRKLFNYNHKAPWLIAPYNFKAGKNFRKYAESFNSIWQAEDTARAPFMPEERISRKEAFPVFYSSVTSLNGEVYALRNGYTHNKELVKYTGGKWEKVMPFASHTSALYPDNGRARFYWSETIPHPRWELDGKSIIRYYDARNQKVGDLTSKGRYYNPQPSEDGRLLAAAEYPVEGGSAVVLLSTLDGSVVSRFPAPAGVQATFPTWLDGEVYSLSVETGGCAVYKISADGAWTKIVDTMQAKVVDLASGNGCLEWISDASGVNEFYQYYPAEKRLVKVSNTRYGGKEFCLEGDYLYYTVTALDGEPVVRTPVSSLPLAEESVSAFHKYTVEDALTEQENAMGAVDYSAPVEFTEPVRYRKLLHPLKFHTWLPVYVNYDAIENASFDFSYDNVSAGLTAFFQNDLGTLSGSLGYALHPDPDRDKAWRNAFHAKLTYTGLFPVFEATLDIGDNAARRYRLGVYDIWGYTARATSGGLRDVPSVVASVKAYVPMSFSKGGLLYGFTPQLRYTVSNNFYNTIPALFKAPDGIFEGLTAHYSFVGFGDSGRTVLMQSVSASLRGYFMLPRARNRAYPKLGVGAEIGGSLRPGLTDLFTPSTYGYMYGYLPGLYQTHGLKLTGMIQQQKEGSFFVDGVLNSLPRGFQSSVASTIANANTSHWRVTADYAMPFTIGGDISLMPLFYIRNFVFTPHFDYTGFAEGNLWSAGFDFAMDMGYVILAALDAQIGVSISYLGGTWFGQSGQKKPWYIGPIFEMSF